ncbi:ImmA/IrrE family metallo-endopeptidase [Campylobacter sp. CCUG 57310]|uniref:ImmA/IrrE family metallo-endopeptidase n=1 Tax=Campylobacter sp. CCUG 57310 TaxID=2517362 RepID=UPI001564FF4F|nr:ImmA/IrrE family metallo-endopeptidase [Campylobacter sp. CCUG 57310]QKF91487.1 zinc-dependent peptidase, M78 family (DUF955 domain) [Campylobacter sp. CCUG 57310]
MVADYTRAIEQAKMLLNSSKTNLSYPINLATILNELNLKAEYSDKITDEALLDPNQKTIFIRRDDLPMTRKLFSIAHEIGHWMLHSRDKSRPRINFSNKLICDEISKVEEQEANAFAAELLMPYDEVRKLIMIGYSVENLMTYFNVSYEFAYYRYMSVSGMIY